MAVAALLALLLATPAHGAGPTVGAENFQEVVMDSEDVWMLEFYSEMCGSCLEFAPTWEKIKESDVGRKLRTAKVNIDHAEGIKLAVDLGVLDGGLPAIRLFSNEYDVNIDPPILRSLSDDVSYDSVYRTLSQAVRGFEVGENGFYRKTTIA
eukprot:CAMPEP_0114505710 /NCGR_PEP_ID=MMETSP0109-20121206/11006_1 /TAXON_ID=29199 /ORGANISM="Chlorarachnion reptans, Strain CCCM449" /LENGTH=151 /DNA_ID=CAMNT_0001684183 /DNA_START=41 /DNA_END=496 /DNA_ORIENTATION=+